MTCDTDKLEEHFKIYGITPQLVRVYGCDAAVAKEEDALFACKVAQHPELQAVFGCDPEALAQGNHSGCEYAALKRHLRAHADGHGCKRDQGPLPLEMPAGPPKVSLILLTYKGQFLPVILASLAKQRTTFAYELIFVDNGCFPSTLKALQSYERETAGRVPVKHIRLCDNPGYATGNNKGAAQAHPGAEWFQFLNDDLKLMPGFLQSLFDLANLRGKTDAGAVGCKLVTDNGLMVLEAGGLVWRDGHPMGFGRGSLYPDAPEFSHARPVDYISGACLLVQRELFLRRAVGGFDPKAFKAYFEDTDLQMHIAHNLSKKIWFQPLAVARHFEHAGFSRSGAIKLMKEGHGVFVGRWRAPLAAKHVANRGRVADVLRARDSRRTLRVLYVDQFLPRNRVGGGCPRGYMNVLQLANLGYRVTAVGVEEHLSSPPPERDNWAQLQQASVELMTMERLLSMQSDSRLYNPLAVPLMTRQCEVVIQLLSRRPRYYQKLIVSRPTVWKKCWMHVAEYCNKPDRRQRKEGVDAKTSGTCVCPSGASFEVGALRGSNCTELACVGGKSINTAKSCADSPSEETRQQAGMGVDCGSPRAATGKHRAATCTLIYDAEALWFRRDEQFVAASRQNNSVPTLASMVEQARQSNPLERSREIGQLYSADAITTVSHAEQRFIKTLVNVPVTIVGHALPSRAPSAVPDFAARTGILFVAGFGGIMYYNGDAVWYFMSRIYPLVVASLPRGSSPIPVTIAGRGIPRALRTMARTSEWNSSISIVESPRDIAPLYDSHRVVVVPHQYTTGVQYKLSEAMAAGVAVVASKISAEALDLAALQSRKAVCLGETAAQLARCVVRLHSSQRAWRLHRDGALGFIADTHRPEDIASALKTAVG